MRSKTGFICDMDGVLYHGNQLLTGVRTEADLNRFAYRPHHVFKDLALLSRGV